MPDFVPFPPKAPSLTGLNVPGFRLLILALLLAVAFPAKAQLAPYAEGGARILALGGAGTALSGDTWGHANAASWATLEERTVGFFGSQAFGLSELRLGALHVAWPFSFATLSATARSVGFDDFRESRFRLGVGRSFGLGTTRAFHTGLAVSYHHVALAEPYGSAGALALDAGWMVNVLPALDLGFQATNLNGAAFSDAAGTDLPRTFALGLSYRPTPMTLLLLDGFKEIDRPLSVRGGVEVRPLDLLALRAGFATEPVQFSLGLGLRVGGLVADVYASRHEESSLGWTPGISFGYAF